MTGVQTCALPISISYENIVLGSALGGSHENGSGIVFNLQITIKYFRNLLYLVVPLEGVTKMKAGYFQFTNNNKTFS